MLDILITETELDNPYEVSQSLLKDILNLAG